MDKPKIILIPGLDGNGFYLAGVRDILRRDYDCRIISHPLTEMRYNDLCKWVYNQLDPEASYIIVAESYAGPLGIMLAERLKERAKGLVLSATFYTPPLPPLLLKLLALLYPVIVASPYAPRLINFFMCNGKDIALASRVHEVMSETPNATMIRRIRELSLVNLRDVATKLTSPCLILKPSHDRLIPRSNFDIIAHKSVASVEGPHGIMGSNPEASALAIRDFIKAHSA